MMAKHLLGFLRSEIQAGRLTESLMPLQSGIGSVANAVLHGMLDSEFENLVVYSEVLQDAVFDLIDAGKVTFASACSLTLSEEKMKQVFGEFYKYRDKLILRPQEISNQPEIIRRLGLISINTALEFDIYGNVNSTHVSWYENDEWNWRLWRFCTKCTAWDFRYKVNCKRRRHFEHCSIRVTCRSYRT